MNRDKRQALKREHELERTAQEITELRGDLFDAYSHFNSTTDSGALDACIFEINALRARYNSAVKHYRARYY